MIEERVTLGTSPTEVMQEHLDRYYFALDYVKNKTVLDIACGTGYGSHILAGKARHVTGADISQEALNYAQGHYKADNLKYIQCDACSIPYPDNSFDVVVSFETLEHIEKYQAFISECSRVLKPGGKFIVSTPNSFVSSPSGNIINPYHVIEFTPVEFMEILKKEFAGAELYGQHDTNMIRHKINLLIMKIKDVLGIKKRLRGEVLSVPSFPVSFFKDGLIKSGYMVAVSIK